MKRREQPEELKCPQWMMTFGDFISLLVTFFVMLIAFSTFEEQQLAAMIGSLRGAFGMVPQPGLERLVQDASVSIHGRGLLDEPKWLSLEELSAVMPDLQMAVKRFGESTLSGASRYITITMLEEGMAIIISVKPLFDPGTATLLPGNDEMFTDIGMFIKQLENEIQVVGIVHKSTTVRSETSNTTWGLAIERAMAVQEGLVRTGVSSRKRFGIGAMVEEASQEMDRADVSDDRFLFFTAEPRTQGVVTDSIYHSERIEIIIVGRRELSEMSPEEVIIRDKWK